MGLAGLLLAGLLLTMGLVTRVRFDNSPIGTSVAATYQSEYTIVAELSAANGDPAVTARNYDTLAAVADSAVAIWVVPEGTNRATVRFRLDADANTATVRALTFRRRVNPGDYADEGSLAYQWAITGGSMTASAGGVYADTGTATAYALAGGIANTPQANWIYEYEMDLRGVSAMAFYRTDATASITVRIDAVVQ